jgi:hypothetical protein
MIAEVQVHVRDDSTGAEWAVELRGGFCSIWKDGLSIGTDPDCRVVLEGSAIAGKEARALRLSIHLMLEALGPATQFRGDPVPPGKMVRVEYTEFQIAHYTLRFTDNFWDEDDDDRDEDDDDLGGVVVRVIPTSMP